MDFPKLALLSGILYLLVEAIRTWLTHDKATKTIAVVLGLIGSVAMSWPLASPSEWMVAAQMGLLAAFSATGSSSVITAAWELFDRGEKTLAQAVDPIGPPVPSHRRWPRRW